LQTNKRYQLLTDKELLLLRILDDKHKLILQLTSRLRIRK
jgi:hypothetical protein